MKTCEAPDCDTEFEPKRSTARYCSGTCRQRAARSRKAVAAVAEVPTDPDTGDAEHGLVRAVRQELEAADRLGTFRGQLALQLARRMANPEESSPAALSKELQNAMAAALVRDDDGAADEPAAEPEDDEVTRARKAREEKATKAAAAEKP